MAKCHIVGNHTSRFICVCRLLITMRNRLTECIKIRVAVMQNIDLQIIVILHVHASIAQLVVRPLSELEVVGSNPGRTIPKV